MFTRISLYRDVYLSLSSYLPKNMTLCNLICVTQTKFDKFYKKGESQLADDQNTLDLFISSLTQTKALVKHVTGRRYISSSKLKGWVFDPRPLRESSCARAFTSTALARRKFQASAKD